MCYCKRAGEGNVQGMMEKNTQKTHEMTILNTQGRYSSRLIYCAGAPNHFTQSGNLCHKIKTVFQYINNISTEDNFNIVKKKLQTNLISIGFKSF